MNSRSAILSTLYAITIFLSALASAPPASAQGLEPATLLNPPTDTWPTYNGDYSGRRYSTLDQINAGNVNSLTLAWIYRTPTRVLKSTPLVVNGIMYFTSPDHVWAIDAKFGRQIWHYQRKSEGDHIGHRGLNRRLERRPARRVSDSEKRCVQRRKPGRSSVRRPRRRTETRAEAHQRDDDA